MTKYLLQQPEKLESLAINKLACWIASQGKKFMTPIWELRRLDDAAQYDAALTQQIEIIRQHLYHNMPTKFHNMIISQTLLKLLHLYETSGNSNVDYLDTTHKPQTLFSPLFLSHKKVIGRMAETLFTENLTSLLLNYNQYKMLQRSLCSNSYMLTGLIRLDLMCSNFLSELEVILILKRLCSLKHLTILRCTDNILKCIVSDCKLIEELNLHSSFDVNTVSIEIVCQLHSLRIINLKQTLVDWKGIEKLLLSCKNIEDITTPHIGQRLPYALRQIAYSDTKFPKLFKLTAYRSVNDSYEELLLLVQMCPLIQNLSVQVECKVIRRAISCNIMAITSLQGLRELTLVGHGFYRDQVKKVLQVIGYNLVHLHLLRVEQIDLNVLLDISQMCPNLQSLSLEHCTFTQTQALMYTVCTIKLQIQPFRNLKKLIFKPFYPLNHWCFMLQPEREADPSLQRNEDYNAIYYEQAFFLLSNCLNVEIIELRSAWNTNDFMLNVLDKNPLIYLKELKIRQDVPVCMPQATIMSFIERIIQNCVNRPHVILEEGCSSSRSP